MDLEKRNYTDFNKFPGHISKTDFSYKFPYLYHVDHNDNIRVWKIVVRLIKKKIKTTTIDWNIMEDDTIPIIKEYLNGTNISDGTISQVYVESGVLNGKITRYPPTYPTKKNKGRSNERNVLEQGLVTARTLFLKKLENGFQTKKDFNSTKTIITTNIKYFPMLVRKYNDEKDNLIYPLYIQPKLDGARCIAYLNKSPPDVTINNVIMYSRQKKEFLGFDDIKTEILPALISMWDYDNNESVYIDGELYKHGLSLQNISGAVRNSNRKNIKKYTDIEFHIFDIFYPHKDIEFKDRLYIRDNIFIIIGKSKITIKVNTILVNDEQTQDNIYKEYIKNKYEGIILRNVNSLYLTHPTNNNQTIRSKYVLKRKMVYSDEFEVISYTEGTKGKDIGAIIWICKAANKLFNATPKDMTYKERYKLFKDCNHNDGFNLQYKNRMMTIEYEDLSNDQVPLRAKSVGFREHI